MSFPLLSTQHNTFRDLISEYQFESDYSVLEPESLETVNHRKHVESTHSKAKTARLFAFLNRNSYRVPIQFCLCLEANSRLIFLVAANSADRRRKSLRFSDCCNGEESDSQRFFFGKPFVINLSAFPPSLQ
ncbi:unnamed protein product [Caenorhabditis auriculariae]|uniref:Uncharacterized protein n=1 Tax=Caenorhabditis auriculariae TaxID=2777116 RepID=A0A8S1HPB4_9PELO|nr:unnamed protein product [Caenorhabditis auriculariae]